VPVNTRGLDGLPFLEPGGIQGPFGPWRVQGGALAFSVQRPVLSAGGYDHDVVGVCFAEGLGEGCYGGQHGFAGVGGFFAGEILE
jgi:hypothetical protein